MSELGSVESVRTTSSQVVVIFFCKTCCTKQLSVEQLYNYIRIKLQYIIFTKRLKKVSHRVWLEPWDLLTLTATQQQTAVGQSTESVDRLWWLNGNWNPFSKKIINYFNRSALIDTFFPINFHIYNYIIFQLCKKMSIPTTFRK